VRDDFSIETKDLLAKRVGYRCSNPNCRQQTSGPNSDIQKVVNIGVAAHIKAASAGGKRFDVKQTSEERKNIENGIWLCQNCAKLIDSDELKYTVELIKKWKQHSEEAALLSIENPHSSNSGFNINADVISINQSGGQTAKTIVNHRPVRRTLSHAKNAIIAELRKCNPVELELHTLMNDIEAFELAKEIKEIFDTAGWTTNNIIQGLGGVYPPGFLVTREKPSRESEIITLVLYNSGLKGSLMCEPRGVKHCIYIGPHPDNYTGESNNNVYFGPREFI
jgi:hypothetical protein